MKFLNIIKEMTDGPKKVLYSAVVLDNESKYKLLDIFGEVIPNDWKRFAHHMTICFGKEVENPDDVGKTVNLTVTHIGISDMAIAAKVEGYPSKNKIPHITLAINPDGGKPVMSNNIENWKEIPSFDITGVVKNVMSD